MQKEKTFLQSTLAVTCAAILVAACGGGGDGSTAASGGSGTLQVSMTDAPSCGYDNVYVTVERIRVNTSASADPADGGWQELMLDRPRQIDLLDLQNGVIEELGQISLPAGNIQQVRFVLADNATADPGVIDFVPGAQPVPNHLVLSSDGTTRELKTPSGQQSGTKINVGIEVAAGQVADLLVDFDACKSVVQAGNSGNFLLKPVLTAIPRLESGVRGSVADALVTEGVSITLQQNGEVVRATAPIESVNLDENGNFILSPVPAGTYDLVVTASGFVTRVVTGVLVPEGELLNLDSNLSTAIDENEIVLLPATIEGDANGTVTNNDAVAQGETRPDTFVDIKQPLTAGASVLIASQQLSFETFDAQGAVNGEGNTSSYSFTLPVNAPEVAPYTATGTFNYSADTAAAGEYSIVAMSVSVDTTPVVLNATASFNPNFVGTTETPREVLVNDFDFSSAPAP